MLSDIITFRGEDWGILFNRKNLELHFVPLSGSDLSAIDRPDRYPGPSLSKIVSSPEAVSKKASGLEKLTILVTDSCNLSCSYCYLENHRIINGCSNLSVTVALNAINKILDQYKRIYNVSFFGGEPLLNFSLIHQIHSYFHFLDEKGMIDTIPDFGITTNGTILTNEIVDFISKFRMSVTVSLDGPMTIHDSLRKDKTGNSTFNTIDTNIKKLIDKGISVDFECTYTMEHVRRGISIVELLDFFSGNYGCTMLHVPLVVTKACDPNSVPIELWKESLKSSIDYSISNLFNGIKKTTSYAYRLLNSLTSKTNVISYCPAHGSSLALGTGGQIFPCGMFLDNDFCLGDTTNNEPIRKSFYTEIDKMHNKECRNCWAEHLCFGCLAEDYQLSNGKIFRSSIPGESEICDQKREIIEYSFRSILNHYLNLSDRHMKRN